MSVHGLIEGDAVIFNHEGTFSNKNVGNEKPVTAVYWLTGNSAGNYELQTTSETLNADITPRQIYIYGAQVQNKVYDGTTDAVVTIGGLYNTVEGDDITGGATAEFTGKNVGTYNNLEITYTISGADAGNYELQPTSAIGRASITPRQLTITGTYADDKVFDGTAAATVHADPNKLGNLVDGESVTLTAGGTFDTPNPGENKDVTVTYSVDDANYYAPVSEIVKATIFPGDMGITFDDAAFVYNAEAHSITVSGKQEGDTVLYSVDGQSYSVTVPEYTDVGEYTIYAKVQRAGYPEWTGSATLTVTPAKATLTFTAEDKVYDGSAAIDVANNKITGTFSGLVGGERIAITINSASFDGKDAGEHAIANVDYVYATPADEATAANYTIDVVMGSAEIKKAEATLTFTPEGKTYDGSAAVTALAYQFNGLVNGENIELIIASAAFDSKNAGERTLETVNYGYADIADAMTAANYTISVVKEGATIDPLAIRLNFEANDKIYDGTPDATVVDGSFEFVSLIGSDVVTVVSYTAQFDNAGPGDDITVSLSDVVYDGTDKDNYTITVNPATASILGPEAASMIVTIAEDTVDPFDNEISLREALTVYFKKEEGAQAVYDSATGTFSYADNTAHSTVTFKAGLSVIDPDAGYELGSAYDYNNLVIEGDNRIIFEGETFQIFSVTEAADITFNGLTFKNITASANGAAISIADGLGSEKTVTINDSDFIGNKANNGGALYTGSLNVVVNGGLFSENKAQTNGGAIYNAGANLSITDGEFILNSATANGGAIYTATGLTVADGNFSRNSANNGGALYGATNAAITVSNSVFSRNNANENGGAIYGGHVESTDDIFTRNSATGDGGAIFSNSENTVVVNKSHFATNTAANGGAIYGISVNVTDGLFNNNNAVGKTETQELENPRYVEAENGEYVFDTYSDEYVLPEDLSEKYSYDPTSPDADDEGFVEDPDGDYTRDWYDGLRYVRISDLTRYAEETEITTFTGGNGGAVYGVTVTVTGGQFANNKANGEIQTVTEEVTTTETEEGYFEDPAGEYVFDTNTDEYVLPEDLAGKFVYDQATDTYTVNPAGDYTYDYYEGEYVLISELTRYAWKTVTTETTETVTSEQIVGGEGGAIYASGTLTAEDSDFTSNTADSRGGAVYGVSVTVTNGLFSNNAAPGKGRIETVARYFKDENGGYVYNYDDEADIRYLLIDDQIKFSYDPDTGRYYADEDGDYIWGKYDETRESHPFLIADLTKYSKEYVEAEVFYGGDGGAIYAGSILKATDSNFTSNTANSRGGAIYGLGASDVTITGGEFVRNSATHAGAVFADKLTVTGTAFRSNSAENYGGAVYASSNGAAVVVSGSVFESNTANRGGAFASYSGGSVTFNENTAFTGNAARLGGAVYAEDTDSLTFSKTVFDGNKSANNGGAVYADSGDNAITITDSSFTGNITGSKGGAVYVQYGAVLEITRGTFDGNKVLDGEGGGAIYYTSNYIDHITINDSTFTNNQAIGEDYGSSGGAIRLQDGTGDQVTISGTLFRGNYAMGAGGAIYTTAGDLTVNYSRIVENASGGTGGGIGSYRGALTVYQSLIADNTAAGRGGGIHFYDEGTVSVSWSTLAGNSAAAGADLYLKNNGNSATATVSHSILLNAELEMGGAVLNAVDTLYGNIVPNYGTFNPDTASREYHAGEILFVGGGDPLTAYRLADGSVAIDGTGVSTGSWKDLDDITRPVGPAADYGAYEYTGNRIVGLTVPYDRQEHNLVKLDGTVVSAQYSADGVNWSDSLTYRNAGTYPVYVRYTDVDGNTETVQVTGEITPHTITVSNVDVLDKRFDGTTTAYIEYDCTGLLVGDSVTVNAARAFPSYEPGTYDVEVTFTLSGADAANYTVTPVTVTDQATIEGPETPSMTVTTNEDVVNAYDGKISLREALGVYYKTDGTMTFNPDGSITYNKGDNTTVTFHEDMTGDAAVMQLDTSKVEQGNWFVLKSVHNGLVIEGDGRITFDGGSYRVFYFNETPNATFNGLTFQNLNGSLNGMAVATGALTGTFDMTVTFNDSVFTGNRTSGNGAAIYATSMAGSSGVNLVINNSRFENNKASVGGSVYLENGGTLTVTGSSFSTVTPEGAEPLVSAAKGGAIYVEDSDSVTIDAIYAEDGKTVKTRSTFTGIITDGTTNQTGGAVVAEGTNLSVSNSTFTGNKSASNGAAIGFSTGNNLTIEDSVFTGNTSTAWGGAVYANSFTTASVERSTFTENKAAQGGALYITATNKPFTVSDSTFTDNRAGDGGAIQFVRADLTVNSSKIMDNEATGNGGGIGISNSGRLTLTDSWIVGNTAGKNGGGLYLYQGNHTIYQSLIADNTANGTVTEGSDAEGGGGICLAGSSSNTKTDILWSTIAGNSAPSSRGNDIFGSSSGRTMTVSYSIVGDVDMRQGDAYYVDTCYKSIVADYEPGIHIDTASYHLQEGDILFTGGDDITKKYTLAAGSPAIDGTGITVSDPEHNIPAKDLNGKTRPIGRAQDYGAFEYQDNRIVGLTHVYNAAEQALVEVDGTLLTAEYSTDGGESWSPDIPKRRNVGVYPILVRYTTADNPEPVTVEVTGEITPAAITVTGTTVANKAFDGKTDAAVTLGTYSGILPADAGTVTVHAVGEFADYVPGVYTNGVTVTYFLTGDETNRGNYVFSPASETFTATITGPEDPSMHVTTATDVVNAYDGLISLREALTVYYKCSGIQYHPADAQHPDGSFDYVYDGTDTTVDFADGLTTISVLNEGYTLTAVHDGLVIDGGGDIVFNGETFRLFTLTGNADVTLDGLTFKNIATAASGSVFANTTSLDGTKTLTVTDSTFEGNTATGGNGGAIYVDGLNLTVTGSTFKNNRAIAATVGEESVGGDGGSICGLDNTVSITDTTFDGNSAAGAGGAIYSVNDPLSITGGEFKNNSSETGGAVYLMGDTAAISGTSFTGNTASRFGGAVFTAGTELTITGGTYSGNVAALRAGAVYGQGTTSISNATFSGNSTTSTASGTGIGGAIVSSGTLTVNGGTFSTNTASVEGGAIMALSGSVSVTGSGFTGNKANAGNGGGAINLVGTASLTVSGSQFTSNEARRGGAIFGQTGSIMVNNNSSFASNEASLYGGAVFSNGGQLTVDKATFDKNAAINAGAVYAKALNVSNSTFTDNSAQSQNETTGGGAIYFDANNTALNISGTSHFENNSADMGGAVLVSGTGGALTIEGGTFKDNHANDNGGAVHAGNARTVTVSDSVFESNTTGNRGGAFYLVGPAGSGLSAVIERSTFDGNRSGSTGGAISFANATLTVEYSRLVNNEAHGHGGAINAESGGYLTVYQSLVADNKAGNGGGIYLNQVSGKIRWSTLAGNKTTGGAAQDLYIDGTMATDIRASVDDSIVLNTASAGTEGWALYSASLYETKPIYSTVDAHSAEYHSGDPLFVGGDDPETKYKLRDGSVAIDGTGVTTTDPDNKINPIPNKDLAGETRPIGAAHDYGAFEYQGNRAYGLTHVYNGQPQALVAVDSTVTTVEYSTDGGQNWTTTVPTAENAGDYTVQVRFTTTGGESETLTVTGRITPLQLVFGQSTPSTAADKTYDGNTSASVTPGQLTNKVGSDDVTVAVKTASFRDPDVGNNKPVDVTYEITGDDAGNYTAPAAETLRAAINPATIEDVSVSGWEGVYNAQAHSITVADPVSTDTILYSTDGETYDLTVNPAYTNAGTYTVYVKVSREGYTDWTGSAVVKINTAEITITAAAKDKAYDGTTDAVLESYSVTGIVPGDTSTVVTVTGGRFADANVGKNKAVTPTYTISGDNGNYTVNAVPTTASIYEAPSMHVTTKSDVVDQYDGLISLREALGDYFGTEETGNPTGKTVTFDENLSEAVQTGNGPNPTGAELTALSVNSVFELTAAHDGLVIDGGGLVAFDGTDYGEYNVFTITGSADITFKNLTFRNVTKGNAIASSGTLSADKTVTVEDSVFSGNAGSAISLTGIGLNVTRGTFSGNTGARGGAINVTSSTVTIDGSTFSGNSATGTGSGAGGGAIYVSGGAVTVNNSTFDGNTTARYGGAIFHRNSATLTVNYSWLVNNTATESNGLGGAIYANGGTSAIYQSLIAENQAQGNGGGIYANNGTLNIDYSTLAANTTLASGNTGRDLYMNKGNNATINVNVRDSIVLDEYSSDNNVRPTYTATLYQSIRRINTTGNANHQLQSGEVLFVGTGEYTEYYKLAENSAAIDGTQLTSGGPEADLAGENRPIGAAYDYGAFEYTGNRVYGLTQTYNGESQVLVGYDSKVDPDSIQYYVGGQWTSTAPECRNAGDYDLTVRYKKTGGGDYIETTVTGKITKKALSLTFTAADKVYDGTTAATASFNPETGFSGLVSGDNVEITVNSAAFGSKNAGTRNVTVNWTADGSDAGNYTISQAALTATISQRQLTITGTTVADKIEDGNKTATITCGTLGNVVSGDTVNVAASGEFPSADPGTYNVTVSYSISGASAANYIKPADDTITASILGPETRSMHVTTYDDVVNKYDGVISLREALFSYYGTIEAGTPSYANDGKTVTFAETLTDKDKANPVTGTTASPVTLKVNSGFTFGSSTYDGVVIDGDKRIRIGGTEESPLTFQIFRLNSGRTATFDGLIFENISTSSKGSAIGTSDDTIYGVLTLKDCSFTNVASTSTGGAVYSLRDALNVTDCSFTNNTATSGSAIYATSVSQKVTLSGTTFTGNHSTGTSNSNGGAVYYAKNNNSTTTDSLTITDCTFTGNDSQKDAAAVFIGNATNATISNSTFTGNTSAGRGGAVNSTCQGVYGGTVGTLTVTDSRFTGNTGVYGGAIYSNPTGANSVAVVIEDSVFDGNTATCRGGAMSFDGFGTPEVKNSRIVNNKATGTFSDTDSGCGGGIYANRPLIVNDSWITGNTAAANGAGIMMKSGAITVYQSLIADNTATGNGGGIYTYNSNSKLTMSWSTVAGNTAASGADFYSNSSISHDVSYSILLSRSGGNMNYTASLYTGTASSTSGHCRVYEEGQPLFVGGSDIATKYTLAANSVAIDGTEVSTGGPATDLNGETRPQGDYYDYGAFEYVASDPPTPPVVSVIVNTAGEDDNPDDDVLSLREALEKCANGEGNYITFADTDVITGNALTTLSPDRGFELNASHDGVTIDGGGDILFDGKTFVIFTMTGSADVTLKNLTFQNIETTQNGTAFATTETLDGTKTLTVDGCSFTDNKATNAKGGAVYTDGLKVLVTGSTFERNSVTGSNYGGALYIQGGTLTIEDNSQFSYNYAYTSGGAVYASGTDITITRSSFDHNVVDDYNGGAVFASGGSLTIKDDAVFTGNSAYYGGAVYTTSSSVEIKDSSFTANHGTDNIASGGAGGAVYSNKGDKLVITNCEFTSNDALTGGGAISTRDVEEFTVTDVTFTTNKAIRGKGGAIYCNYSGTMEGSLTITGTGPETTVFTGNESATQGGAVYLNRVASANVEKSTFTNNKASNASSGAGGAIYCDYTNMSEAISGQLKIEDSIFTENQSFATTNHGGGALCLVSESGRNEQVTITDTVFAGNTAVLAGGAIATYNDLNLTVIQSLIVDNTCSTGGGIYLQQASGNISWSTLANNTNKDIAVYSSSVEVSNSIALDLADSVAKTGVVITNSEASAADLFTDGTNADPKLRDYTLKAGSAAIDATGVTGSDPEHGIPDKDLNGNPRPYNTIQDCGAYEYQGASPASLPYSDAADAAFSSLDEDDLGIDFDVF